MLRYTPPGNSGPHNNAENDQTPNGHNDDLVSRFIEENPVSNAHQFSYNWHQDDDSFLDYQETPIDFQDHIDIPDLTHLDTSHFDHHGGGFDL